MHPAVPLPACVRTPEPRYKNLDRLIHYTNLDGRINAFYSSPHTYAAAKLESQVAWPERTGDLFPYADAPHAYWTGYFTSRPTSKYLMRRASRLLHASHALQVAHDLRRARLLAEQRVDGHASGTAKLEAVVALTQHHDAITGTEKQHVANNYHRRLHDGMWACWRAVVWVFIGRGWGNP